MSCFLCGHEKEGSHHLGCARIVRPDLTEKIAKEMGLLPASRIEAFPEPKVEVLKEGSMTTVPEEDVPAKPGTTVEQCDYPGCDNPRYSDHPRAKYCEDHKDPKNRKE